MQIKSTSFDRRPWSSDALVTVSVLSNIYKDALLPSCNSKMPHFTLTANGVPNVESAECVVVAGPICIGFIVREPLTRIANVYK